MHVRRTLALTFAVPLLLAGCSDEAQPTPKMPDPTTSSSTPSPSQSETPQAESAEDFIRRWVKAGDEMQVSGNTDEYRSMVDKSCKACRSFISSVEDVHRAGGSIEFKGSTIEKIVKREKQPPTFALTKSLPKTVIDRGDGGAQQVLPAGKTTLLVILKDTNGWAVTYYGIL